LALTPSSLHIVGFSIHHSLLANCDTKSPLDLAGSAYLIQPVVFTAANWILSRSGDDAARAVILYAMNGENVGSCFFCVFANNTSGASSVLFSFWGIALYPATDAANVSRLSPSVVPDG
jgi:hypothetical protein